MVDLNAHKEPANFYNGSVIKEKIVEKGILLLHGKIAS